MRNSRMWISWFQKQTNRCAAASKDSASRKHRTISSVTVCARYSSSDSGEDGSSVQAVMTEVRAERQDEQQQQVPQGQVG